MKANLRVTIELLAPGPLAVLTIIFTNGFKRGIPPSLILDPLQSALEFVGVSAFVSGFTAVPALFSTLALEMAFARGLSPRSWMAVALSAFLGGLSGLAISLFLGGTAAESLAKVGGIVGAVIGLLLKFVPPHETPEPRKVAS